jgi:hypothetical protein
MLRRNASMRLIARRGRRQHAGLLCLEGQGLLIPVPECGEIEGLQLAAKNVFGKSEQLRRRRQFRNVKAEHAACTAMGQQTSESLRWPFQ